MHPTTDDELVFVYGTLRRGGSNAFRMEGAEFVAEGRVAGRLYRISWYPGLVLDPSDWVLGDLFRVSPSQLRVLDEYEGLAAGEVAGSEYRRTKATVYPWDRPDVSWEAWVWEWIGPVEEEHLIASGDWMDMERPRQGPWFTIIAACCLVAFPLGVAASAFIGINRSKSALMSWASDIVGIAALVSPVAALLAAYLGSKRREKWVPLRGLVVAFAGIVCALLMIGVIVGLIESLN